ncbi:TPA: hypothetical protein ACVU5P_004204 [Vibrio parahaemolyticus]
MNAFEERIEKKLATQKADKAAFLDSGNDLAMSEQFIGFTSCLKVGFVHPKKYDENYISTAFRATKQAIENPDQSIIVELKNELIAVSKAQYEAHGFKEVTLKLVDNNWVKIND